MNLSKLVRKIVTLLVTVATMTSAFAQTVIPGVGIVIKKNPGGGAMVAPRTGGDGRFAVKLAAGEYTVSIHHGDAEAAIARMAAQQKFKSRYQGTGLELRFDPALNITIKRGQSTAGGTYNVDRSSATIVIVVTGGEAVLRGQLSWNDDTGATPRGTLPDPVVAAPSAVVNGACSTAWQTSPASVTTAAQMQAMHCTSGTLTSFTSTTDPITWQCAGSGGGTTATCSKPKPESAAAGAGAACGPANGVQTSTPPATATLCSSGLTPSIVTSSSTAFTWTCSGLRGGAMSCSAPK